MREGRGGLLRGDTLGRGRAVDRDHRAFRAERVDEDLDDVQATPPQDDVLDLEQKFEPEAMAVDPHFGLALGRKPLSATFG